MQSGSRPVTRVLLLLTASPSLAFRVEGGGQVTVNTGNTFLLSCRADGYYEFCTFRSAQTRYQSSQLFD